MGITLFRNCIVFVLVFKLTCLQVAESQNDGRVLLSLLALCRSAEELLTTMAQIHGPWAFVYWQASVVYV